MTRVLAQDIADINARLRTWVNHYSAAVSVPSDPSGRVLQSTAAAINTALEGINSKIASNLSQSSVPEYGQPAINVGNCPSGYSDVGSLTPPAVGSRILQSYYDSIRAKIEQLRTACYQCNMCDAYSAAACTCGHGAVGCNANDGNGAGGSYTICYIDTNVNACGPGACHGTCLSYGGSNPCQGPSGGACPCDGSYTTDQQGGEWCNAYNHVTGTTPACTCDTACNGYTAHACSLCYGTGNLLGSL